MKKFCLICDKKFTPNNPYQKCCSVSCVYTYLNSSSNYARQKLKKGDIDIIYKMYCKGSSHKKIGRYFNISHTYVGVLLKQKKLELKGRGLKVVNKRNIFSASQKKQIIDLVNNGFTAIQLRDKYNISYSYAHSLVKKIKAKELI